MLGHEDTLGAAGLGDCVHAKMSQLASIIICPRNSRDIEKIGGSGLLSLPLSLSLSVYVYVYMIISLEWSDDLASLPFLSARHAML